MKMEIFKIFSKEKIRKTFLLEDSEDVLERHEEDLWFDERFQDVLDELGKGEKEEKLFEEEKIAKECVKIAQKNENQDFDNRI